MPIHGIIAMVAAFAAGAYVDHKFMARAVMAVRTEVAKVEAEIRSGFSHTATSVLARVKRVL